MARSSSRDCRRRSASSVAGRTCATPARSFSPVTASGNPTLRSCREDRHGCHCDPRGRLPAARRRAHDGRAGLGAGRSALHQPRHARRPGRIHPRRQGRPHDLRLGRGGARLDGPARRPGRPPRPGSPGVRESRAGAADRGRRAVRRHQAEHLRRELPARRLRPDPRSGRRILPATESARGFGAGRAVASQGRPARGHRRHRGDARPVPGAETRRTLPAGLTLTRAAVDPAMSRYPFQLGLPAFREAAAAYMQRRFGVACDPFAELHPLLGSKEGIAHLAMAVLDRGDVAIVPDPGYPVYHGGTVLAQGEPHLYPITPRSDFLVELDAVPADVLKRTRLVYLNYPNNPTAAIAPRDYLERTVAFCRRHDIVIAYDNPYCEITFDGYVAPSIFEIPGARDVAVEFHSLSKSFCMTGWRLGWAVGRSELVTALSLVKSYVDTGAFLAVQAAGAAVLHDAAAHLAPYVAQFKERRDAMLPALRAQGFEPETPRATMYIWVPLPEGLPSAAFQRRALEEAGVIVMPGSGFGAGGEGFFRVALTVATPRLVEGAARLGKVLAAV